MKKKGMFLTAMLLCGILSACGTDAVEESSGTAEETTAVTTETTAEEEAETTTTAEESEEADTTSETTATEEADTTEETTAAAPEDASQAEGANGGEPQNDTPQQNTVTEAPQQSAEPYLLDAIRVETECSAYLAAHPSNRFEEAISCIGEGKDRTYTYDTFKLITYFENGTETLKEINLTAPGIATRKGISVGSSAEEVVQAYGAPEDAEYYGYQTEDGTVEFSIEGGRVVMILFYVF
ncbi:MAG: hypothetical protein MJ071_02930 [Oscillospiraceae bacterium]|nr:hypothetical protein [Oscillospiraceae bacterium]